MYRRCAVKYFKKQVEFINCVNMSERVKKARALPSGLEHLGVKQYIVSSSDSGSRRQFSVRGCT